MFRILSLGPTLEQFLMECSANYIALLRNVSDHKRKWYFDLVCDFQCPSCPCILAWEAACVLFRAGAREGRSRWMEGIPKQTTWTVILRIKAQIHLKSLDTSLSAGRLIPHFFFIKSNQKNSWRENSPHLLGDSSSFSLKFILFDPNNFILWLNERITLSDPRYT